MKRDDRSAKGIFQHKPLIEIPEHLKYRAPKPQVNFSHVQPRWQEPKMHIDPDQYYAMYKPIEKPSSTLDVVDVPSRWQTPKPAWTPPVPVQVPRTQSLLRTPQYVAHKQFASNFGMDRVPSKYFDGAGPPPDHVENKRELVENENQRKLATQTHGEGPFRYKRNEKSTFSELMPKESKRAHSPIRDGSKSVVMAWINKGVPIPGAETVLNPELARQQRSPTRRTVSPERPWKAGRVDGKAPPKPAKVLEDKKIESIATNFRSARTASPPRVAHIPIPARRTHEGLESPRAHMRPQYDASIVNNRLHRTNSGVSSYSSRPTTSPRGQASQPATNRSPLRHTPSGPTRSISPTARRTTSPTAVRTTTSPMRQPAQPPRTTTVSPRRDQPRPGSVSPTRGGHLTRTYSPVPSAAGRSDTTVGSMNLPFAAMAPPSVVRSVRR